MKSALFLVVAFAVVVAAAPGVAQTVDFTATCRGGSSSCTTSLCDEGGRAVGGGAVSGLPVCRRDQRAVRPRLGHGRDSGHGRAQLRRGYGSVSETQTDRANCIFDSAAATSAVSTICSRPNADCSKGIVGGGFSQGSVLSILAKNYDARVRAAYALGAGVQYSLYDLRACVADGKRKLTSDRLRVVNGEVDEFMGGTPTTVRSQLQELTGLTCTSSSWSCFRPNNSGWSMVSGAETDDGTGEHCYMRVGGCTTTSSLDSGWLGTFVWSLDTNLQWLTGFTER